LTPYVTTGGAWPNPQLVTIGFVPDGTILGSNGSNDLTSNLQSTFNARFGSASAWQTQILKAAATWAQYAPVNFAVVTDNGADAGSGNYEQGDPNLADIRIGGFNFGSGSTALATAYEPPPVNDYSLGGDFNFNTGQTFNVGSSYDVYSVALHEIGHALGLDHQPTGYAVMNPSYATNTGLFSDDVNGLRAIYGTRPADSYDAAASNNTLATASDITSTIDPNAQTALLTGLDLTGGCDVDYYKFTAPSTGTMKLSVTSAGLSLLSPKVTLYSSSGSMLAQLSGSGKYGTTLTLSRSVTAGTVYKVKVEGAESTALGQGAYAMTLNFGNGLSPTVSLPNTLTLNGNPITAGANLALSDPTTEAPGRDVFGPAEGDSSAAATVATPATPALQGEATNAAFVRRSPAAMPTVGAVVPVPTAAATAPVRSADAVVVRGVSRDATPPVIPVVKATATVPDSGGTAQAAADQHGDPGTPAPAPENVTPAPGKEDRQEPAPAAPAVPGESLAARDAVFAEQGVLGAAPAAHQPPAAAVVPEAPARSAAALGGVLLLLSPLGPVGDTARREQHRVKGQPRPKARRN
jgi:hypothetical protein